MDCSSLGSPVHGILQTRILAWVAFPSSTGPVLPHLSQQIECTCRRLCVGKTARWRVLSRWRCFHAIGMKCTAVSEKAMAPHSSTLAWKIPWAEEPCPTQSRTRLSDFTFTFHCMHWRRKWQPTPVFLPGESQGRGEPGGLPSMGSTRLKRLSSSSNSSSSSSSISSSSSSTAIPPLGGAVLPGEASLLESPIHSSLTWPQSHGEIWVYSFLQRGTPQSHLPVYSSRQSLS